MKNLYTEYGAFFREPGCKSFDIGGDELLGWCDTPATEIEDEILEHIRPYFSAFAKKALGQF